MGFKRDWSMGKQGEDFVEKIFKKHQIEIKFNDDSKKLKEYDLIGKIDKKQFTVEVKFDYMAQKTNNLAIEYKNCQTNEKSGIEGTKANLWCHIILDQGNPTAWLTSVEKLRSFIKKNKPWKIIERAGDGNASLYLY